MELDKIFIYVFFIVSTIPFLYISLKENGSSRGWISRLFVGQDFLILITSIFLGSALGEGNEHLVRNIFGVSLTIKLIMGFELIARREEYSRNDPLYRKEDNHYNNNK